MTMIHKSFYSIINSVQYDVNYITWHDITLQLHIVLCRSLLYVILSYQITFDQYQTASLNHLP